MEKVKTDLILNTEVKGSTKSRAELESVNKGLSGLSKSAKSLTLALGAAGLGGVMVGAINKAREFEKSMSKVEAITESTASEMEGLTDLAKEMGKTTVFTASEAADAMTFLGMAGFETEQIMDSLAGTLNLAAASGIDLGRAADISSNILTGFGKDAKEIGKVVDVLAKTVTSSNTDMEQLAEAMKYIAPMANTMGISIEETAAAVGILGDAGLQGSMATRALGTSLARLSDPTTKMAGAIENAGLEAFDTSGKFVGLASVIEQLEVGLADMTEQQRVATLSIIFGKDALKNWSTLVSAGSEDLREFTTELENSGDTAQKMADTQIDNLDGSVRLLNSAVDGLAISFGEAMTPAIRESADMLTDFTGVITENEEGVAMLGKAISILIAVPLNGLVIILQKTTEWGKAAGGALYDLIQTAKEVGSAVSNAINSIQSKLAETSLIQYTAGVKGYEAPVVSGERAKGGPVNSGETYLVGERGPELFTPSIPGNITPNNKMGGMTINISGIFGSDAVDEIGDAIVQRLTQSYAI